MTRPHIVARLYRVILPVADIERAASFYGTVLGAPGARVSPGRHYFDCGGVILACYSPSADGDEDAGPWRLHPNQYVYFAVADLAAARERVVRGGGREVTEIADMPWGERLFYARDPSDNPICFVDETTLFTGPRAGG